jgi:DNA-binding MarR family transcriptional regulator
VPTRDEFIESFATLTRSFRAMAHSAYEKLGVGTNQAKILRHVGKNGPMSQAELARATIMAPALVGRALASLISRGWVRRKRSDSDRREYVVELTSSGDKARKRVEEARKALLGHIADALDERDLDDFDRVAKKLMDAFEKEKDV